MKIINTLNQIDQLYSNNIFDLNKWKIYINMLFLGHEQMFIDDMNACLASGSFTYEGNVLPLLNNVLIDDINRNKAIVSFNKVTANLEADIMKRFHRSIDLDIYLYVGLCNGAGWVTTIAGRNVVLLGIEKIMELGWTYDKAMYGLIYHELGHAYQAQYGILERDFPTNRQQFLWQLFTEGIAMHFEQLLLNKPNYFHQDYNGWGDWCNGHLNQIKQDFAHELDNMHYDNQRYFGDWVSYQGHGDVGYYLGSQFVDYICTKYAFDDILSFDITLIEELFQAFLEQNN